VIKRETDRLGALLEESVLARYGMRRTGVVAIIGPIGGSFILNKTIQLSLTMNLQNLIM
jgi:hypothetical protein